MVLHSLHGIAWYCMVLHGVALSCTILHHLAPSCTILHHHKSNCQIPSPSCTQICHLNMYDPYTSTHTIIRVTAKFRHQLAPRFATSVCMTHIPALTPS